MMFRDQVGVLIGWFKGWNECEQTVALLSLLKRISRTQARFLQLCLEHSLADCTEIHVLESEANSAGKSAINILASSLSSLCPGGRVQAAYSHSDASGACIPNSTCCIYPRSLVGGKGIPDMSLNAGAGSCGPPDLLKLNDNKDRDLPQCQAASFVVHEEQRTRIISLLPVIVASAFPLTRRFSSPKDAASF